MKILPKPHFTWWLQVCSTLFEGPKNKTKQNEVEAQTSGKAQHQGLSDVLN